MSTGAMTTDPAARREERTLIVGTRLALAATTMLQFSMLFAYLYLRGNNFNGGWRPDGIGALSTGAGVVAVILHALALGAVIAAVTALRRGGSARALVGLAALVAIASFVVRVWWQYHLGTGWTVDNGTYPPVSMMWLAIFLLQSFLGCIWLLALLAPGPRASDAAATSRHLHAFSEYWTYVLVLNVLVWLLIRFV